MSKNENSGGSRGREARRKFRVLELFCGCGGLSHGFFNTGDFEIVGGVDLKEEALETFRRNHKNSRGNAPEMIRGDIREIEIRDLQERLGRGGVVAQELDCLIGGPPCQGFSQLRRSKEREDNRIVRFRGYDRLDEDPRNDLVLRFLEIAEALQPKVIVIENVPQMMLHAHKGVDGGLATQIMSLLGEMEYEVVEGVLNAADFAVPQIRDRVFIVASRVGKPLLPSPNASFYKKYYWSAYTRLDRERPALTITANANFLGSGRFTHPQNDRGITMREAARLQSFEDEFTFLTSVAPDATVHTVPVSLVGEVVDVALEVGVVQGVAQKLHDREDLVLTGDDPERVVSAGGVVNSGTSHSLAQRAS